MSHRPDDELLQPGYVLDNAVAHAVLMAVSDTLEFCNEQPMIDNGEGESVFVTTADHRLVAERMRASGFLNIYNYVKAAKKCQDDCDSGKCSG